MFETTDFLLESIRLHYTKELKRQAAKILGSVDFLGNPLGLFSDVAEGMSGLLELNIGGLVSNLTHGVSNTAAKVLASCFYTTLSRKQNLHISLHQCVFGFVQSLENFGKSWILKLKFPGLQKSGQ